MIRQHFSESLKIGLKHITKLNIYDWNSNFTTCNVMLKCQKEGYERLRLQVSLDRILHFCTPTCFCVHKQWKENRRIYWTLFCAFLALLWHVGASVPHSVRGHGVSKVAAEDVRQWGWGWQPGEWRRRWENALNLLFYLVNVGRCTGILLHSTVFFLSNWFAGEGWEVVEEIEWTE